MNFTHLKYETNTIFRKIPNMQNTQNKNDVTVLNTKNE